MRTPRRTIGKHGPNGRNLGVKCSWIISKTKSCDRTATFFHPAFGELCPEHNAEAKKFQLAQRAARK